MKPQTYNDWRELLGRSQRAIGYIAVVDFEQYGRIRMNRDLYRLIRRVGRIRKQLEAEWEAGTEGAMMALLEMIFKAVDE
jgi:hypothetical protein